MEGRAVALDTASAMESFILYLPIFTTVVAITFATAIARRYRARRGGPHLAWWTFGALSYAMRTDGDSLIVQIDAGLRVPPGGIAVRSPMSARRGWVNGATVAVQPNRDLVIRRLPARVVLAP